MADISKLQELAGQLRHPDGERGIEIAGMMHETNIGMTRHSLECLDLHDWETVIELGHGNCGHLAELLAPYPSLTYYGLETSGLMAMEARRQNDRFTCTEQAHFCCYDGQHIPFHDHFFDKAFTVNTLYFWENPEQLLSELYRVLKPGGLLTITYMQESYLQQLPFARFGFNFYSDEKIMQLIASTSFIRISTREKTEPVNNKGKSIDRDFATVILKKI